MNEDLARRRSILLNLVRLGGLALVLLGLAIQSGRISGPPALALVLTVVGLAEFFFMPGLLARYWRRKDQP